MSTTTRRWLLFAALIVVVPWLTLNLFKGSLSHHAGAHTNAPEQEKGETHASNTVTSKNSATSRPTSTSTSRHAHAASKPHHQDPALDGDDEDCDTGCAADHGHAKHFHRSQVVAALKQYAQAPPTTPSKALETLLFHADASRHWFPQERKILPSPHQTFLQQQLKTRHAYVSMRIVDQKGQRRVWMAPKRVEIGKHFHLHADKTQRIQAPSFGGRVERVGLYHLWTRI